MLRPAVRAETGFTLVEVVVVLIIVSVLIAMAAMMTRGMVAAQKRSLTTTRMATVEAALTQFVAQQRRLPCPAFGVLAASDNNAGVESNRDPATGCTTSQLSGVVPWRTLGLTEQDATDGWDRRLTYRVFPLLAADNAMNLANCDPAGGAGPFPGAGGLCNPNCTAATLAANCTRPDNFLQNKGLQVQNGAGAILMDPATVPYSGAAYVLISHGETGGGAFLNSGNLSPSSVVDGNEESRNYANLNYLAPNPATAYFVDAAPSEISGANHFDDVVARPTILNVASRAGLSPRPH